MRGRLSRADDAMVPRVSIGVPVFNAERYLERSLNSLVAQDFGDLEVIVCDNASTDSTWEICQRYASIDPRIRCYRNDTNLGAARNYNRTVELARGDLFKWAAYDDICAPTFVSKCVGELDRAGARAVLAYPRTTLIDESDGELGAYRDGLDLRSGSARTRVATLAWNISLCNAVMGVIRTDVLRRTGLIRPHISSDITLLAELASLGEFHEIPERLFFRRIHPQSSRQGQPKSLAVVAAWFDPSGSDVGRPRARIAWRTAQAFLRSKFSVSDRITLATTFALTWTFRKLHIHGSHLKRRLLTRRKSVDDAGQGRRTAVNGRRLDTQSGELP